MPQRISRNSAHKIESRPLWAACFQQTAGHAPAVCYKGGEKFRLSELFRSSRVRTPCGMTASFEAVRFKRLN